jgi:preprotein translocase subunit SecA
VGTRSVERNEYLGKLLETKGIPHNILNAKNHEREGEIIELDSRTSDAIALAVRFQCPIFTYEFILDTAGVELDESTQADIEEESDDEMEEKPGKNKQSALSTYSLESLQNMLLQVLEEENYEKAATIRDEIDKRKRDLD